MRNVGLRGNPAVVDMTSHGATTTAAASETKQIEAAPATQSDASSNSVKPGLLPPTLVLAEIICTQEEKDTFMYYILNKVRTTAASLRLIHVCYSFLAELWCSQIQSKG